MIMEFVKIRQLVNLDGIDCIKMTSADN